MSDGEEVRVRGQRPEPEHKAVTSTMASNNNEQQIANSLPHYLKDINKSHDIYDREEYSYLNGLSIRPTKRKLFVPNERICTNTEASSRPSMNSSNIGVSRKSYREKSSVLIIPSLMIVFAATLIALQRKQTVNDASSDRSRLTTKTRRKVKQKASILVDSNTGSVEVIHNSMDGSANQSFDVRLTKSASSSEESGDTGNVENSDVVDESCNALQTVNESIMPRLSGCQSKTANLSPVLLPSDGYSDTISEILYADSSHGTTPIEQIMQRWESRGLNRQKSLELAAHFEMNMLFFRELQHFLSMAIYNLVNKISNMHVMNLNQAKQQHREQMDAPLDDKLRLYRKKMNYMLLNVFVVTRCILVATASKLYFLNGGFTASVFQNAPGIIFSSMCPECLASSIEADSDQLSSVSIYGFDFLSSFVYRGVQSLSCTWFCSMKIAWYASWVVFCHQYISRSLACAVFAVTFIYWKSLIQLGIAVVTVNALLTLLICRHIDAQWKRMEKLAAIQYFEHCTLLCGVLSVLPSVLIGLYF